MRLFIARHGEASFNAPSDEARELTERGIQQTEGLVKDNLSDLKSINEIWVSRLIRAKQTAEIFEEKLGIKPEPKNFLTPESEPSRVLKELEKQTTDSNLLIVSHQPLVGSLVSLLTEGHSYQPHPYMTSEVVVLEMDVPAAGLATVVGRFIPD